MDKHCNECGKIISYGLRCGDMIFCNDECAERFGIDPLDCFYGGISDYLVCDIEPDHGYMYYS